MGSLIYHERRKPQNDDDFEFWNNFICQNQLLVAYENDQEKLCFPLLNLWEGGDISDQILSNNNNRIML